MSTFEAIVATNALKATYATGDEPLVEGLTVAEANALVRRGAPTEEIVADAPAADLPSPDYMRGYLMDRSDDAVIAPTMRAWLEALIDEVAHLRTVMAERPVPQLGMADGERLTEAEVRVYRYLRNTNMTGVEIARALWLSPNTIKTHSKSIYRKCQVDRRSMLRDLPNL